MTVMQRSWSGGNRKRGEMDRNEFEEVSRSQIMQGLVGPVRS